MRSCVYMNPDRREIFRRLKVEPRGIYVVNVQLALFVTLTFDCRYDPERQQPFQLIFEGCKNIVWETFSFNPDEVADVINLLLGSGNYHERAVIHTDLFEVSLLYERLSIQPSHLIQPDAPD